MEEEVVNINNKQVRFSDAAWYRAGAQDIIIGGAGGIGSWLSLFLGRIGHNLYLFDNDTIEEVNMAGQLYSVNQIGKNKAAAIAETIYAFSGNSNVETLGLYTEESEISPIMFSAFDNMKARKTMFSNWMKQEDREVFIDGRVLAEVGMVFCVQKGQEEEYIKYLFDDSEIEEAPCSFKATSHCGALIASLMTAVFNNYLANRFLEMEVRQVNFKTDFELPSLNFQEM